MTDNVLLIQGHNRDIVYPAEPFGYVGQTRHSWQQIALVRIAGKHHCRPPAKTRQQHLELGKSAVLRLVDHHERVIECAPTHESDRRNLDHVFRKQRLEPFGPKPFAQHVVDRTQIGRELRFNIAGQKSEGLARIDRGPTQDDPLDPTVFQSLHRLGHRQKGLARAGGAERKDDPFLIKRLDQRLLACALGTDVLDVPLVPAFLSARLLTVILRKQGVNSSFAARRLAY
jgi:hypothetical protein